jgi:2-hydroxycyclohexanecarboxyl-CoA dehydrogenase
MTGPSLEGARAVITGAGRGLGRGIALALAKQGASVACLGRTQTTIDETARTVAALGVDVLALRCDVTSRAEVFAAIDKVGKSFGAIDALVNNAMDLNHLPIPEITEAELDRTVRSCLYGSLFCMQACFPYLKQSQGAVVNFASAGGTEGWPGQAAYAAAKEAVRGLTKSAASEWGPLGIRVNAVAPMGFSDAFGAWYNELSQEQKERYLEGVPLRRIGDPETDIGSVVAFLIGPGAGFITGRTIFVDGGRSYYDR